MDRPFPDDGRWPHPKFEENRLNAPDELIWQYANQLVAWNDEGTQILAGADDYPALYAKLDAMGVDTNRVMFEYLNVSG